MNSQIDISTITAWTTAVPWHWAVTGPILAASTGTLFWSAHRIKTNIDNRIKAARETARLRAEKQIPESDKLETRATLAVAALMGSVATAGMFGVMHALPIAWRIVFASAFEIAETVFALRARRMIRMGLSAGRDTLSMWALAIASGTISAWDSTTPIPWQLRLIASPVAAYMWHTALVAERKSAEAGQEHKPVAAAQRWLRRMAVRLGLMNPDDTRSLADWQAARKLASYAVAERKMRRGAGRKTTRRERRLLGLDDRITRHAVAADAQAPERMRELADARAAEAMAALGVTAAGAAGDRLDSRRPESTCTESTRLDSAAVGSTRSTDSTRDRSTHEGPDASRVGESIHESSAPESRGGDSTREPDSTRETHHGDSTRHRVPARPDSTRRTHLASVDMTSDVELLTGASVAWASLSQSDAIRTVDTLLGEQRPPRYMTALLPRIGAQQVNDIHVRTTRNRDRRNADSARDSTREPGDSNDPTRAAS